MSGGVWWWLGGIWGVSEGCLERSGRKCCVFKSVLVWSGGCLVVSGCVCGCLWGVRGMYRCVRGVLEVQVEFGVCLVVSEYCLGLSIGVWLCLKCVWGNLVVSKMCFGGVGGHAVVSGWCFRHFLKSGHLGRPPPGHK